MSHRFEICTLGSASMLAAVAAKRASEVIRGAIKTHGRAHVMFATGDSQLEFLEVLTADESIDWGQVTAFHMDEYLGIEADDPASLRRYLRERVVEVAHPKQFHWIEGDAGDPAAECARYSALLQAHPLDLCCVGIGENGHLAFNDPPVADFDDPVDVKVVALDDASRRQQVGEGHFATVDDVPSHAITVTIPALLRAHTVFAIVPEARKSAPVHRAVRGSVDTECPASILRTLPHVTMFLDADSSALIAEA